MQALAHNAFPLRFDLRNRLAAHWVAGHFLCLRFRVSFMAKIPSRKFPKTKRKIPSRKFPKVQRKIPSRKFAQGTVKLQSRPFPKPPLAADKKPTAQVPLGRPINDEERQARLAALATQTQSLRPASDI
jgi:hypothetical protein